MLAAQARPFPPTFYAARWMSRVANHFAAGIGGRKNADLRVAEGDREQEIEPPHLVAP